MKESTRQGVKVADINTHRDHLGYNPEYSEPNSTAASIVMSAQWALDETMPEIGTPAHFYYATAVKLMREVYRLRNVITDNKSRCEKLQEAERILLHVALTMQRHNDSPDGEDDGFRGFCERVFSEVQAWVASQSLTEGGDHG